MIITPYYPLKREVFWGKELSIIQIFTGGILTDEWRFEKIDNMRLELSVERVLDSDSEMDDGMIRQRVRGFRLFADFSISRDANRDLLMFIAKMFSADSIIVNFHDGTMENPNSHDYSFPMMLDSNFEPKYFDGRWIGHNISFRLKALNLMPYVPKDANLQKIILATTKRGDGITSADPITSTTFWSEKMYWGGWEKSIADYNSVAFYESAPDGEGEPYGEIW